MMKPRLGKKVYCLYGSSILVDTVGYLGKDGFILSSFDNPAIEMDSLEWLYEEYGANWFGSLKEAKKMLIKRYLTLYGKKPKIVKAEDGWYEAEIE